MTCLYLVRDSSIEFRHSWSLATDAERLTSAATYLIAGTVFVYTAVSLYLLAGLTARRLDRKRGHA